MPATPDTSAKLMREASEMLRAARANLKFLSAANKQLGGRDTFYTFADDCKALADALADALDQQAAAPDPKRFAGLVLIGGEALMSFFPRTFSTPEPMGARPLAEMYAATVLAAAFPELAPPND